MDSISRNSPKTAPPLAWLLVWLGVFLETTCLYLIPALAVHRPSHYGLPPRPLDWHVPLLLSAIFASALVGQGWYTQKNDRRRFKPKTPIDPAQKKKQKLVIGLVLGGPLLLLECGWVFGQAGARVDWPLLLALNGGMAAGWGLLLWALRLMPDPLGPDTDPLAPAAAPAVAEPPPPVTPREVDYSHRTGTILPEAVLFCIAFVGLSAVVVLSFGSAWLNLGPGRGGFSPLIAFLPMELILALLFTGILWQKRKRALTRYAVSQDPVSVEAVAKEATGAYMTCLVCGGMCAAIFGLHQNWLRLAALNVGTFPAYLLVGWAVTRLPRWLPTVNTGDARAVWLPRSGVARATPTEIVLQKPRGWRVFVGGFSLVMWGMVMMAAVLAFDPTVLPGPYPHGAFWRIMPGGCALGLAFFAFLISAGSGPRELRLDLAARTYQLTLWKPLRGELGQDAGIPYQTISLTGTMDAEMAGVGLREYRRDGNSSYVLKLVWKDAARPAQILRGFTEAEEARAAMGAASAALGLPALGRVE